MAKLISVHWAARQKEIEIVWLLLPDIEQNRSANLQERIMACLLMTPFSAEPGRQVGAQLAKQFGFQLERLGQLQGMLAEQLFTGLAAQQIDWLAPRLTAFWAEMIIGYGQELHQLHLAEQAAQQQKLMSEFQQVKRQATESEQRFEALFEELRSPVFIHENGRILAINRAVTQVFGYTSEELVGQQVQALLEKLTLPAEQAKILKHLQAWQEKAYQTQCLKKDGSLIAVEAAARYVAYRGRTVRMVILRPLDDASLPQPTPEEADLTPRQEAVLQQMAIGLTDKEIAEQLGISLSTVNHHKREIFEKLQVNTRAKAIAWVWQKLPPPDLST